MNEHSDSKSPTRKGLRRGENEQAGGGPGKSVKLLGGEDEGSPRRNFKSDHGRQCAKHNSVGHGIDSAKNWCDFVW
jgi:hypothetical protein